MDDKMEKAEQVPRIANLRALKAELELLRTNTKVKLETTKGTIEGQITSISGDRRGFAMKVSKPETLKGANVEFLLEGALTSAIPQGVDIQKCFRITTRMPDGTTFQQWSGEIKDLRVLE